jgi:tetratricopeptide (TPR) repeat protein
MTRLSHLMNSLIQNAITSNEYKIIVLLQKTIKKTKKNSPMKRTILLLIFFVFAASLADAQRAEVRRAERQLNRGNLEAAKTHIDVAAQDASTSAEPETWVLMGQIYMQIASAQEAEYRALSDKPLEVAYDALQKAQELDVNNLQIIQIQQMLLVLSELTFNEGVEAFNNNNYGVASGYFLRSYRLSEPFGAVDTTTLYNAALAAELNEDYEDAKRMYLQLVDYNYDQPYLYSSLSHISMEEGDTTAALGYVKQGREIYPDDLNLVFSEANIYIFTGMVEEARDILSFAIEKDPENPSLYFALAANFDRMTQDTVYAPAERLTFFEEAERYYKKAIELQPDFFDAIYNLGVLYYNEGIRLYEAADMRFRQRQDFARLEKDEKEYNAMWLQSQPYFEKSKEMIDEDSPYYEVVIMSLVQVYVRTNQPDKLKEIEDIYLRFFGGGEEE